MTLDSWLVTRLALELDRLLRGARVVALRAHERGLTLECERRRDVRTLQAWFDPDHPVVAAVEGVPQTDESGPGGWAGGVAALLRGSVVDAVRAVPDDRILNVDVSSRSAFGVPARHRLVLELEPRKANALIVRPVDDDGYSVLAAARRVESAGSGRDIKVGQSYEPPPPRVPSLDRAAFVDGVRTVLAQPERDVRALIRLLGAFDPACTPPLARRLVDAFLSRQDASDARDSDDAGDLLLRAWEQLHDEVNRAAHDGDVPLYLYRRGDQVVACHVVALPWANGTLERVPSFNDVCASEIDRLRRLRVAPGGAALRKKLERALERCDAETASLKAAQERALQADGLRRSGDAIYGNLASVPEGATVYLAPDGLRIALDPLLTAKQNAADYFKRYKKARSGLPRIAARLARLAELKPFWEHLVWELDRADADPSLRAAIYDDVSAALVKPARDRTAAKRRPAPRQREAIPLQLPGGAIAYVGRSPKDNERLTFAVARPNDWWFHARGVPGAHVILKLAHAGEAPTRDQIAGAAALAAGASRASDAGKVEVDYTQRKHVRRRGKGATGLVWYTDFKTVLAAPPPR